MVWTRRRPRSTLVGRLDVPAPGLTPDDQRIAAIIAEETEAERAKVSAGEEQQLQGLGQPVNRLYRLSIQTASWLPWDTLLTKGNTAMRCARRAGMRGPDLVMFAYQKLPAENPDALFWFGAYLSELLEGVVAEDLVDEALA